MIIFINWPMKKEYLCGRISSSDACPTHLTMHFANVKEEVIYNVKRLRNHASLAFWCGNNEIDEGLDHWGWDKEYSAEINKEWREGYTKTFHQLIPELVNEYDGTCSYIHGSPYNSNWGNKETFSSSDVHDWGLWHG